MRLLIALSFLFMFPVQGSAQTKIPSGSLSVTYRHVENGEVANWYHEVTLSCYAGNCSLRTVTLNRCWSIPGVGSYSVTNVKTSSTSSNELKIISVTKNAIALQEQEGDSVLTYRFSYKPTEDGSFGDLTDFSGGGSKNSNALGKVVTWEMAPLRAIDGTDLIAVKLDCPIRVAALPTK